MTGLVPVPDVAAQGCFEHIRNFNYTPSNCSADPVIDRVFRIQEITWKNHNFLFVDEGNEIRIFIIDNPTYPISVTASFFDVPNVGDSDYDLVNFSVCDDCRYGVASYKAATVLFDLGTGSMPSFVNHTQNDEASIIEGGFTFRIDGQQYLVASSLGPNPCTNNKSGLYEFNGVDEANNPVLQCLDNGGFGPEIVNGFLVEGTNPEVFYMAERFDQFHIYRWDGSNHELDYMGNGGIERANMDRGYGADADESAGLLAVAKSGDLKIYDIGYNSGSPVSPVLLVDKDLPNQTNANAVALQYPIVHVAQQNTSREPRTFDISNPTNPVPLDQEFWDPANTWNSLGDCLWNQHALFSRDGAALYLSRYSSLQVIDPTACPGSVPPVANLTVSPQPAFPGDVVTVNNTSAGGERYATWITDGADPHGSSILAGTTSFGSGQTLIYTLAIDMAVGDVFYAHAAVESDEYPYTPGSTPDQIKTVQITIDRTPSATLELTPEAVIVSDTVTLSSEAEGNPSNPLGGSPFEWTVTGPSLVPNTYTGNPVTGIEITENGLWTIQLKVYYEHEKPAGGSAYIRTVNEEREITSVAADFTITPSNPFYNEMIILTSTSRAQTGATLEYDWDVLNSVGTTIVNGLGFCDDLEVCLIPAETLDAGIYDFRLTLTNTNPDPDDVSVAIVDNVSVLEGDPNIDFTISNSNPEIGEYVGFVVTGVSVLDIEQAFWTFGGTGCEGGTSYTCVEPHFPSCDLAAWAYASGGAKTVSLTVTTTGGVVQPVVQHSLSVQYTGSCGSASCTYLIDPSSRNVAAGGGSYTITVDTTPNSGCSWFASSNNGWIQITSGASGNGDGTVSYLVAENTGPGRVGTITVAGKTHTVIQEPGNGCDYAIDPSQSAVSPLGGTVEVQVSTGAGCQWEASTNNAWITVVPPGTGSGPGLVTCEVAKGNADPRTGLVTIADQIHVVSQDGAGFCGDGEFYDDGSPENAYGWGNGRAFVQRFTPESYPYVYSGACAAFTQAGGDTDLEFGLVVLDDDGPGGGPGSVLAATPASISNVPPWMTHEFTSVSLGSSAVLVESGSVFIGVVWDDTQEVGFFVAADESTTTPAQVGFFSSDYATWEPISGEFPDYRSLLMRAVGISPVDGEWTQVVGSAFGGGNGFGDPFNSSVCSMTDFGGDLVVGTANPSGAEVNFTHDGVDWYLSNNPGFGNADNHAVESLSEFGAYLYASTRNDVTGCEVWRGNPTVGWYLVQSYGFGDFGNLSAPSSAMFGDHVYFGTTNSSGCEIWRSGDGLEWQQVHTNGFGDPFNGTATSMAVFRDELYVSTSNSLGAEIWKTSDGVAWFSVVSEGFGSSFNQEISDLAVFNGKLYAAVSNAFTGTQLWRSVDGDSWEQMDADGFGNPMNTDFDSLTPGDFGLYAGVSSESGPGVIFVSADGESWVQSSSPGFEDLQNSSVEALLSWNGRVYAGTKNDSEGCEVWLGSRHFLFHDGFESGGTGAWTSVIP